MFKIIMCFFIALNSIVFGKIVPHPSYVVLSEDVTLDRGQVFNLESETIKITGLGNMDRIYYSFSNYDERLQNKNASTQALIIENIKLVKVAGNHNEENGYIDEVRGQTNFRILAQFRVKPDPNVSGEYTKRITLRFSEDKNSISNEGSVDIQIRIKVLKVLQLTTTAMDLGSAVKGQPLSTTSGGTPGYLKIDGSPNARVKVNYPSTTFIYNKSNSDKLLVNIKSTPSLDNDGNLKLDLSNTGEYRVRFDGDVRNTSTVSPGEYKGSFKIQVRYD
ncbi:DUF4402 domain-containing protein [Cetobacterium sp. 8H]|uniref:DUF4402 domain-containing protein n=1 Tax=Cetobacterium sp. 8H TaxID=2759681 RepID=UPI00163CD2E0|nr:DUF4402 domain-containing protein [Cetobacterium sp. 8H]MBC2850644.1 DUF4402 domain-containing protein [Cetobacterium sp. 8H]